MKLILVSIAALLIVYCGGDKTIAGGSTDTENAVFGFIYQLNGLPAPGVTMNLFSSDFTPISTNSNFGTAITDSNGRYQLPPPITGSYNIVGFAPDNRSVFIDNVLVPDSSSVEVRPDTIRPSGGIRGVTYLAGLDSISQVRVSLYMPGTNFMVMPNIGGNFSITNVPSGKYRLIINPTFTEYHVKLIEVTVYPARITDLGLITIYSDSISGLPIVEAGPDTSVALGDTLILNGQAQDPFGEIVKMEWSFGDTGQFHSTADGKAIFIAPQAPAPHLRCVFRVLDNDNNQISDTLYIEIAEAIPNAIIGNTPTAMMGRTIALTGSTSYDRFRPIIKYEWDIGNTGQYVICQSPGDTSITLPNNALYSDSVIVCILRVTNSIGNIGMDTCIIRITKNVVIDSTTNLIWLYSPPTTGLQRQDAIDYCNNLSVGQYTGWRLPTIDELLHIYPYASTLISSISGGNYWSSTFSHYGTDENGLQANYKVIDLSDGFVSAFYAGPFKFLPVHELK